MLYSPRSARESVLYAYCIRTVSVDFRSDPQPNFESDFMSLFDLLLSVHAWASHTGHTLVLWATTVWPTAFSIVWFVVFPPHLRSWSALELSQFKQGECKSTWTSQTSVLEQHIRTVSVLPTYFLHSLRVASASVLCTLNVRTSVRPYSVRDVRIISPYCIRRYPLLSAGNLLVYGEQEMGFLHPSFCSFFFFFLSP